MGQWPCRGGCAFGQSPSGTGPGEEVPGPEYGAAHVLRRRVPLGADGRGRAEAGLSACVLDYGRLQGNAGGAVAHAARGLRLLAVRDATHGFAIGIPNRVGAPT